MIRDRARLAELAAQVTEGVILEVGAKTGVTTCILAKASSVPVYCIDMWDLTFLTGDNRPRVHKGNYAEFLKNIKGLNIIHIKGLSAEIAKVWQKPIGLIFIDGDHSYQGCKADYNGFAKHIIPGGVLAMHDYEPKYKGVMRMVDEIRPLWTDWEIAGTTVIARRK